MFMLMLCDNATTVTTGEECGQKRAHGGEDLNTNMLGVCLAAIVSHGFDFMGTAIGCCLPLRGFANQWEEYTHAG